MSLLERMNKVTDLYDSFTWGKNGVFTKSIGSGRDSLEEGFRSYEYNITKNDIFYLQKRKKGEKIKSQD